MFDPIEKDLKPINRKIFESATKKRFFGKLVKNVKALAGIDPQRISDGLGRLLGTAVWNIAHNESFEDWKSRAEIELLCLGDLNVDLEWFYKMVQTCCKTECDACFCSECNYKLGVDIASIDKEVDRMLNAMA